MTLILHPRNNHVNRSFITQNRMPSVIVVFSVKKKLLSRNMYYLRGTFTYSYDLNIYAVKLYFSNVETTRYISVIRSAECRNSNKKVLRTRNRHFAWSVMTLRYYVTRFLFASVIKAILYICEPTRIKQKSNDDGYY